MKSNHYYNKNMREFAVELRTETISKGEKYLWKALQRKQQGIGFKRQRPIKNYIVDFFAQQIGLVIEIDGNSHLNKGESDRNREDELVNLGYTFLRFKEGEVLHNLNEVLVQIQHAITCLNDQELRK